MERNRRTIRQQEEQRLFNQSEEERQYERTTPRPIRRNQQQEEERFDAGFRQDERTIPTSIRRNQQQEEERFDAGFRQDERTTPRPISQPLNFAFGRSAVRFKKYTDGYTAENINYTGDWEGFMETARNRIIEELSKNINTKVLFSINVNMRQIAGGFSTPGVKNLRVKEDKIILEGTNLNELYDQIMTELNEQMEKLQDVEGSGWVFEGIKDIQILTLPYYPLRGGKYLELPEYIAKRKAVVNIKNKDEDCFKWSILRGIYPKKENPSRVDKELKSLEHTINMEGIESPTKIDDIPKFEKQNEDIAVVVLGLNEDGKVYTILNSKYVSKRKHLVILLLITNLEKDFHYTLVTQPSRLISSQYSSHGHKIYICWNCINIFNKEDKYNYHIEQCKLNKTQNIIMPEKGSVVKFRNYKNTYWFPFVVYADIECITTKLETPDLNPDSSYTIKTQSHKPISYVIRFISYNQLVMENKTLIYVGEDCMDKLVEDLEYLVSLIYNKPEAKQIYEREDKIKNANSHVCHVCGKEFTNEKEKTANFEYFTGEYLGACHNNCKNTKPDFMPIFFHNLAGYDSHLFITKLANNFKGEKVDVIPTNEQKYISFTKSSQVDIKKDKDGKDYNVYYKLRFVDSLKFMNAGLETLANNLPSNKFNNLEERFTGKQLELAKRKGIFPYDWFDSVDKLKCDKLPPMEDFYSKLYETNITREEYNFALEVWKEFGCKTFKDYVEIYNLIDTLLLADIFENFREICFENYGIDPACYFTSPGLFWDALLKETGIELELLSDIDMFLFFKRMIRGGISMISTRYAEANNPYMKDLYDPEKENSYIMYYDANNLYGFIMMGKIPYGGFQWMEEEELNNWRDYSCVLEVELEYPKELHDLHNDLPLCPENITSDKNITKLIPTLNNKEKYVIHYKTLLQFLELGLILKKIHCGIKFNESEWMKPYIDKNTELRKVADNDFEKDFYKLANNGVFGKGMEDETKRCCVKLVTTLKQLKKLTCKKNLKGARVFSEGLISVHMANTNVKITKPIYIGAVVLDTSKIPMYDFHYNYIKKIYGNKARLLDIDTDGVKYHIITEDVYKDMNENIDVFDTSNYPVNHPSGIRSGVNKKVPGKFKDELGGEIIKEYAGVRSKLYSYLTLNNVEEKKAKGIKKYAIKNKLIFNDYKDCVLNKTTKRITQSNIRSYDHKVYTEIVNKVALNWYDDKRYIMENGIDTLSWGNYKIE